MRYVDVEFVLLLKLELNHYVTYVLSAEYQADRISDAAMDRIADVGATRQRRPQFEEVDPYWAFASEVGVPQT